MGHVGWHINLSIVYLWTCMTEHIWFMWSSRLCRLNFTFDEYAVFTQHLDFRCCLDMSQHPLCLWSHAGWEVVLYSKSVAKLLWFRNCSKCCSYVLFTPVLKCVKFASIWVCSSRPISVESKVTFSHMLHSHWSSAANTSHWWDLNVHFY